MTMWLKNSPTRFDGHVEVGGISFLVTEELIIEVTALPTDGEEVFRSHVLAGIDVPFFLRAEFKDKNKKVGVQRSQLEDQWHWMLHITQSYFMCEGHFNRVNLYHFHFLAHLARQVRMNSCFYLLESLKHMDTRFWARADPSPHFIYQSLN